MIKASSFTEIFLTLSQTSNHGFLKFPDKLNLNLYSNELFFLSNIVAFKGKSFILSALPKNFISDAILRKLNEFKIDTTGIILSKKGKNPFIFCNEENDLSKEYIINRKGSLLDKFPFDELDFSKLFQKSTNFHISATMLSLSYELMQKVINAIKLAKQMELETSFDFVYNKDLWKYKIAFEKVQPINIIFEAASYCDFLTGTIDDVEKIFEFDERLDKVSRYENILLSLSKNFPHAKAVAILITKNDNFNQLNLGAAMYIRQLNQFYFSPNFYNKLKFFKIPYKSNLKGISSAFASGIIYGFKKFGAPQLALDWALANSILKTRFNDGFNYTKLSEIEAFINKLKTRKMYF